METETIHIQLPPALLQQVRQKAESGETTTGQIFTEALQIWLERDKKRRNKENNALNMLRKSGIVMSHDQQHRMAENIRKNLKISERSDSEQVRAVLSKLRTPLSEEIIAMRGER